MFNFNLNRPSTSTSTSTPTLAITSTQAFAYKPVDDAHHTTSSTIDNLEQGSAARGSEASTVADRMRADLEEVENPGEIDKMINQINTALASLRAKEQPADAEEQPAEIIAQWKVVLNEMEQINSALTNLNVLLIDARDFDVSLYQRSMNAFNVSYGVLLKLRQEISVEKQIHSSQEKLLNLIGDELDSICDDVLACQKIMRKHSAFWSERVALEISGVEHNCLQEARAVLAKLLSNQGNSRHISQISNDIHRNNIFPAYQTNSQQQMLQRTTRIDRSTVDVNDRKKIRNRIITSGYEAGESASEGESEDSFT